MVNDRRAWIYSGLALPSELVWVSRGADMRSRPRKVLLVGDGAEPRHLAVPLSALCSGEGVAVEHYPVQGDEPAADVASGVLRRVAPGVAVLAVTGAHDLVVALVRAMQNTGARVVHVFPPQYSGLEFVGVDTFPTPRFSFEAGPGGGLTVRGYAAWAGALWVWL